MLKLTKHFGEGGRSVQVATFTELVETKFDPSATQLIEHINNVEANLDKLESQGFEWTRDMIAGMFYQL